MIYNTFSKRAKRAKQLQIEKYDEIPDSLRNQIISILEKIIESSEWGNFWHSICDEKGKHRSEKNISYDGWSNEREEVCEEYQRRCLECLEKEKKIEGVFDLIEIAFKQTHKTLQEGKAAGRKLEEKAAAYRQAVEELNTRFYEAEVGYRLVDNCIEQNILYLDMARPALNLLRGEEFKKANEEFYRAHKHYKDEYYENCVTDANKSFESVMKAVCGRRGWDYKSSAKASDLINILREKLFPNDDRFKSVGKTLNGLSLVRNDFGAHGSEPQAKETSSFVARYALHLTATNILFLMQAVESIIPKPDADDEIFDKPPDLDEDIPF